MSEKWADLEEHFRWKIRGYPTVTEMLLALSFGQTFRLGLYDALPYLHNEEILKEIDESLDKAFAILSED